MSAPRIGVIATQSMLSSVKRSAPVDVVLWRDTFVDPPRQKAAVTAAQALRARFGEATEIIPWVWSLVTHGPRDLPSDSAKRSLPGDPQRFGGLQASPEVEQAWSITAELAERVGATRVVLETPPSLTPGPLGRARLRAFREHEARAGLSLLWNPQGLWEPADAGAFARDLGIEVLTPAFVAGRMVAPESLWLRVDGAGASQRVPNDLMDALIDLHEQLEDEDEDDHVDDHEDDHVKDDAEPDQEADPPLTLVFGGPNALGNARAFADARDRWG